MAWNYRVFKTLERVAPNETEDCLTLRVVLYNKNGVKQSYSENESYPSGITIEELKEDLQNMLLALDKPILTDKDF